MSLRDYLIANMFDGEDHGTVTFQIGGFIDDICEHVALWMVDQSGVQDRIEEYYTPPHHHHHHSTVVNPPAGDIRPMPISHSTGAQTVTGWYCDCPPAEQAEATSATPKATSTTEQSAFPDDTASQ